MARSTLRFALAGAAGILLAAGLWWRVSNSRDVVPEAQARTSTGAAAASSSAGRRGPDRPVPVQVARAEARDIRVVRTGLGSVVSFRSATVKSRVEGQLVRVLFEEGALVERGQVIAEIDPRPFQAAVLEVRGQVARERALLDNARLDFQRYQALRNERIAKQEDVDARESLVRQHEGSLLALEGSLEQAKLKLAFSKVTAPISGRIGLRLVDEGNNVSPSDPGGIAVINAVQPISVLFTLPEDDVAVLTRRLSESKRTGAPLVVEAWDKGSKNLLGRGKLVTLDNQIDPATGTVKLKAEFENEEQLLFPNQFVNVRLVLESVPGAIVVPPAAIQRGSVGPFVYAVTKDRSVERRPVKLGPLDGAHQSVESGVREGDLVVVSGADRLRDGSKVLVAEGSPLESPRRAGAPAASASAAPKTAQSD
jgi:multidrug efflux system membrane fusion protein